MADDSLVEAMARRVDDVEHRIAAACLRAGRARQEVTLVAVSKTRSMEEIEAAYRCGLRHLGENRVEEAVTKVPLSRQLHAADPVTWHMIGHVQSRKARDVVQFCDMIHSVDSCSLAMRLDRFAGEMGKKMPILLELNVSGEESKYGFAASDDRTLDGTMKQVLSLRDLVHLDIRGLMTMAPIVADAELARPIFERLRAIRDIFRRELPFSAWSELSMGMTDDMEVAIEEGATMVRVGRALFGPAVYYEEKKR